MTPIHTEGMAAAQADYDAALVLFRVAQARLKAAKAALKPFLDEAAASAKAEQVCNEAAAVKAWLDGATEIEAAVIAGYKSPKGFDSVRDRLIRRYAPETVGTAWDECQVDGRFSLARHRELERRHASIALARYHDAISH